MVYRFHDYTLDPAGRELRHGAQRLALEPKVLQVLLYLLEHRDRVVPKDELLTQCWPGTFVSESALTRCLARLRKAVQPTPTAPPVLETRHRQGYRFVADVTVLEPPSAPVALALSPAPPPLPALAPPVPPVASASPAPPAPSAPSGPLPPPLARPAAPAAERRQLTVLFCDVVDSTTLAGRLDPEDFRDIMARYHATGTTVIQYYDGHVAQYLGDGLLVYFGWPQAHEDDARRAVHAGLALLTAVRDLNTGLEREAGLRLALRIGMHTGLVVVGAGEEGTSYSQLAAGATPNLAAKMQTLAAPDTVVISAATYRLVQGYFVCASLGEYALPGMPEPGLLYQVQQASGAQGRLDITPPPQRTPFVGREAEMAVLRERAAQVRQGQGQVVLLQGEAGIGKSRLLQEVTAACVADGFTAVAYHCSPYHQHTALHPVVEWLQRTVQGEGDTTVPARLGRLEHLLQQARLDLAESVPLLAALLPLALPQEQYPALQLTPQRQRQRTLETLLALLLGLAARQPMLIMVEDLHWSDPTTLEWLSLVLDQGPTASLFTLLTCRPTFASPWGGRTHVTPLTLPRLAAQQVTQMVQWLGEDHVSAAQRQRIVRQTDGVPLFIEEVTKFVLAELQLQSHTGHQGAANAGPTVMIPVTLQDSLMARLDQLGAAKSTAQLGATIGREFPVALLQAVTPLDEDVVRQDLKQMVEAELLYQHGVGSAAVYQFKHALIQEAAYQSLLKSTRQQYHQRIAQALETQFPETAETQSEVVAQHYTAAGVHAQALPYWQRAGQRAFERSAYREAVASLERGLEAVSHLPQNRTLLEQAVELRLTLRSALLPSGNAERILATLREAETLAVALDDARRLGQISRFLSVQLSLIGTYDQAMAAARRALTIAMANGEVDEQVLANERLGQNHFAQGDYRQAIAYYQQAVASLDEAQHHERFSQVMLPAVNSRAWLAWCHAELGTFAEGRAFGEEALRIAETVAQPASLMRASLGVGLLCLRQGALARALPQLERAADICNESDLSLYLPQIAPALGTAYILSGRVDDAVPLLTQAVEQTMATGMVFRQTLCYLTLGEAQRLAGHLQEAQALAEWALAQARVRQERGDQAYALRLFGDIAAQRELPEVAHAEAYYQQALTLAEALGMRPLQAHCHYSLGILYGQTGRVALARAALSTAMEMYCAMAMAFWMPQAEAALAQLK